MTDSKAASGVDINHIAYDAPLSIPDPSGWWCRNQSRRGNNNKRLTAKDVPGCDLTGKWVVISGSNNGIGREAALQFAAWGANLVLACRDPPAKETHPTVVVKECKERAKNGESQSIEWWEIDMARLSTVEAFAKRWLDTGRALDVLCNNAGIGSSPGGNAVFRTEDGFEIVHQINFLSHVLLTLRLLPSLAMAPGARVVCTTSCFHFLGDFPVANFNGDRSTGMFGTQGVKLYQNNKLWFQVWLTELQHRLHQHDKLRHISINGVHPGYVNSGIWNLNSNTWVTQYIVKAMAYFLAINEQQGSLAITNCATSPQGGANLEKQGAGTAEGLGGGKYFNRIWEDEPMPYTKDRDCRLRVWRKVNDELKLEDKGLLDTIGLYATDL